MTVEWFDLAQRLAANRAGTVLPRLTHSPVWPTTRTVAVRATQTRGQVTVTAYSPDTGGRPQTRHGSEALRMLADLGVLISGDAHTLITDETETLPALLHLAENTTENTAEDGHSRHSAVLADVAAHIGWWADRADFPGTSAVTKVPTACATRWVTGTMPRAERSPATWRTWLGIRDESTVGLFDLWHRLCEGTALPKLAHVAEDDSYAFGHAAKAHADGWDWRTPDTLARAASGLRSRCDAADLWQAALLDDPLYRRRAVHTGHVVHGTAKLTHPKSATRLRVICDRMDARLRAGATITGWTTSTPGTGATESGGRFPGTVTDTSVSGGKLALDLLVAGSARPTDGARVTLAPAAPDVHRTRNGRSKYRSLYATRSSWLTTGRTPAPQRRDVPLDVLLAGASDD